MANAKLSTNAKHAEITRRYAWQAKQRKNGDRDKKPDRARLITLVRMRELERIFQRRYGRFLPDDDAGRDDLVLAAHHVAHLGDDAIGHIIAWCRAWTPWLSQDEARAIAERVAGNPQKFTADVLAWRLRLSMVERTELAITTIGAFDCSKAEREQERRRRNNESKRIKRAEESTGRPRGRPRKTGIKNAGTPVEAFAVPAISDEVASVTAFNNSGPDLVATKPSAEAVGTPFTPQNDEWSVAEGAALVGNSSQQRGSFKTRFPTAMRLDNGMAHYGLGTGYERQQVKDMFETFRCWNVAQGSYSFDWREAWFAWVDRQVGYDTELYHRERARTYFEQRARAQ